MTCEPTFNEGENGIVLKPGRDQFMILGCDGLWERHSDQEIIDFVKAKMIVGSQNDNFELKRSQSQLGQSGIEGERLPGLRGIVTDVLHWAIAPGKNGQEAKDLSQGMGLDNTTCILVDLRKFRN